MALARAHQYNEELVELERKRQKLAEKTRAAATASIGTSEPPGSDAAGDAGSGDVELLLPLLGAMSAEKVRSLVPRLVALPLDLFKEALDRLCGERAPLSPSEIFVALHEVDPARSGVGLKKIIAACGECFERRDAFGAETLASAISKMVEMHPLPLLFMRTVIQAETVAPGLREFTLGILRALCRRRVWTMDPKLWEGFMRCAKRATPRSFPVLCELPAAKLAEVVAKFPAMREPMRAYANAPAVAAGVPRAIKDVLNQS